MSSSPEPASETDSTGADPAGVSASEATPSAAAASLSRLRPGGPRVFPVLPEYRSAAQLWLDPEQAHAPVTPVDAAAVALIRDSPRGLEVYLTVHEHRSAFGPVGFPGGRVLAVDDEPLPWSGPTGQQWGRMWHEDVGLARRCVVAAARELFGSVGVLVAGRSTAETITTSGGHDWRPAREALASGETTLRELLERRRLLLRTELMRPLARWMTPQFMHRRYDVRYFLVIQPEHQEPETLAGRAGTGGWVSPAEVLRDPDARRLSRQLGAPDLAGRSPDRILTPGTAIVLEELAGAGSAVEAATRRVHLGPRAAVLRVGADGAPELAVEPRPRGSRQR